MESLRAFARSGLDLFGHVEAAGGEQSSNDRDDLLLDGTTIVDSSEILAQDDILMHLDVNDETKLFHSLNRFSVLLNNLKKEQETPVQQHQEDNNNNDNSSIANNDIRDANNNNIRGIIDNEDEMINLLRYGLLRFLRRKQCTNCTHKNITDSNNEDDLPVRQVLNHWWVALLEFLNYNKRDPNITLLTVILECLSRIMTIITILPEDSDADYNIFCNYLLLTTDYVTGQFSKNSRALRHVSGKDHNYISSINKYNQLLQSLLGQLNAFNFIYLPNTINFDILLISLLTKKKFKLVENSLSETNNNTNIFPWKQNRTFKPISIINDKYKSTNNNKSLKSYRIIISYLKNDKIFISFYWYYWFIILNYLNHLKSTIEITLNDSIDCNNMIFGSEIIIDYCIDHFLRIDLFKYRQFMNPILKRNSIDINVKDLNRTVTSSSGNSNINSNNSNNKHKNKFSSDLFKIWISFNKLSKVFPENENLIQVLAIHDHIQLKYLQKISAYDHVISNLIFNNYLLKILKLSPMNQSCYFIKWEKWCQSLVFSMRTLNYENQTNALLFIFNSWKFIPLANKLFIIDELLAMFATFMETSAILVLILFNKVLVFKFMTVRERKETILEVLVEYRTRYLQFLQYYNYSQISKVEMASVSPMIFQGNKKFILSSGGGGHGSNGKNSHNTARFHGRTYYRRQQDGELEEMENSVKFFSPIDLTWESVELPENRLCQSIRKIECEKYCIFKVVVLKSNSSLVSNYGSRLEYYNSKWQAKKKDDDCGGEDERGVSVHTKGSCVSVQSGSKSFIPIERTYRDFDLTLFDGETVSSVKERWLIKVVVEPSVTEYERLLQFVKIFNCTITEYCDFMNLVNNRDIYIEYT